MLKIFLELNIRILLILLVFGLITGFLRYYTYQNLIEKKHGGLFVNLFNMIGVPVHEMGHLIFALLFGYEIKKICLYRTLRQAKKHGGTLGYVKMSHRKNSVFSVFQVNVGQFFVGIGPLISGPSVIIAFYYFLPTHLKNLIASISMGKSAFLRTIRECQHYDFFILLLFIYVVIGISMNMELSKYDLEMAWKGVLFLEIIFMIIALISTLSGINLTPDIITLSQNIILIASIGIISSLFTNLLSMIGL